MKTTATTSRLETVLRILNNRFYMEFASEYGEPGYTSDESGILFCDWNNVSRRIQDYLEENGFELQWSDEWHVDDNMKAWRIIPDSYQWTPQIKFCDGFILTPDDDLDEWIEECKSTDWNQPHGCLPEWVDSSDLSEHGYTEYSESLTLGFHGNSSTPQEIYQAIEKAHGPIDSVLFQIDSSEQFQAHYKAFWKA